jgi:hypothetical protein
MIYLRERVFKRVSWEDYKASVEEALNIARKVRGGKKHELTTSDQLKPSLPTYNNDAGMMGMLIPFRVESKS